MKCPINIPETTEEALVGFLDLVKKSTPRPSMSVVFLDTAASPRNWLKVLGLPGDSSRSLSFSS